MGWLDIGIFCLMWIVDNLFHLIKASSFLVSNPSSAGPVHIWPIYEWVITFPAGILAPSGTRPPAGSATNKGRPVQCFFGCQWFHISRMVFFNMATEILQNLEALWELTVVHFNTFSLWLWLSEWACSWLLMSLSSVVAVFMKYCPCMGMLLGVHCWGYLTDILSSVSSHCTCRSSLQQHNLQMSWNDLSKWQAIRNLVPLMACQGNMPLILIFTTSSCHFCVHLPVLSLKIFICSVKNCYAFETRDNGRTT